MKYFGLSLILMSLIACGTKPADNSLEIQVSLNAEKRLPMETETRSQLLALHNKYDLENWIFTREVVIKSGVIPHSHPILTLNTKYNGDEVNILATYLHEQFHWYAVQNETSINLAIEDLRDLYPQAPDSRAKGGARNLESTYLHLIICMLEYGSLRKLLGDEIAQQTLES